MAKFFNSVTGQWEDDGKGGIDIPYFDINDIQAPQQGEEFDINKLFKGVPGLDKNLIANPQTNQLEQWTPDFSVVPSPLPTPAPVQTTSPAAPKIPSKMNFGLSFPSKEAPIQQTEAASPYDDLIKKALQKPQQDDELASAMRKRQETLNENAMLRAMSAIGSGLAYQKPDENLLTDVDKNAGVMVSDVLAKREEGRKQGAEARETAKFALDTEKGKVDLDKARLQLNDMKAMDDANSDISKAFRETIRSRFAMVGRPVNIPNNLPASALSKLYPTTDIVDDFIKLKSMEENKRAVKESKEEATEQKLAKEMTDTLDLAKASSRSPLGLQKTILDDADRALGLYTQFKNGNMPAAQTEEFALATARLISGGRGGMSRGQIEALVPHTTLGNVQKTIAWLTNNPVGQNQQKFVNLMHETALREKEIAKNKINEMLRAKIPRFEKLKEKNPQLYKNILGETPLGESTESKVIVKKQYSKSANKTKIIYNDGSEEILDGQK